MHRSAMPTRPVAAGQAGVRRGGPLLARRARAQLRAAARLRLAAPAARPAIGWQRQRLQRGLHQQWPTRTSFQATRADRGQQPARRSTASHCATPPSSTASTTPSATRPSAATHAGAAAPTSSGTPRGPSCRGTTCRAQRHARRVGHPPAAPRGVRPRHRVRRLRHDPRAQLLRHQPLVMGLRDVEPVKNAQFEPKRTHAPHCARPTLAPSVARAQRPRRDAGLAPAALPQGLHLTACSANKAQTCNSQINRADRGASTFNLDRQVGLTFRRSRWTSTGTRWPRSCAKTREPKQRRGPIGRAILRPSAVAAARETQDVPGRRAVGLRLRPRPGPRNGPRSDLDLPPEPANGTRRKLYVNAEGVFDLDNMLRYTKATDDWLKVTDRYWGLTREQSRCAST